MSKDAKSLLAIGFGSAMSVILPALIKTGGVSYSKINLALTVLLFILPFPLLYDRIKAVNPWYKSPFFFIAILMFTASWINAGFIFIDPKEGESIIEHYVRFFQRGFEPAIIAFIIMYIFCLGMSIHILRETIHGRSKFQIEKDEDDPR